MISLLHKTGGVLGAISIVLIIVTSLTTGHKYYRRKEPSGYSWISLTVSLGLITYVLHGFLNNFLDTDKASALFWGFISIIVALDIYQSGETKETLS